MEKRALVYTSVVGGVSLGRGDVGRQNEATAHRGGLDSSICLLIATSGALSQDVSPKPPPTSRLGLDGLIVVRDLFSCAGVAIGAAEDGSKRFCGTTRRATEGPAERTTLTDSRPRRKVTTRRTINGPDEAAVSSICT